MRPVGLVSLPIGYTRLDFLESTGTQYIDTEYAGGCTAKFRYAILQAATWEDSLRRWGQVDALDNSRGSVWRARANGYFNLYACFTFDEDPYVKEQFYDVTHELCDNNTTVALTVNGVRRSTSRQGAYTPVSYNLFDHRGNQSSPARERLGYCSISSAGKLVREFLPALDNTGTPCMFDLVTKKPFYNAATTGSDFIAGFDMNQAESLGSLIPANTTLTVSFPWEASLVQHNSRVENSLEQAENKGCFISVRYREPEKDSPIYNKYAECATAADIADVNPDYKTDLTENGAWEYPLTKLANVTAEYWLFRDSPILSIDIEFPAMTYCGNVFRNATKLETARISLPAIRGGMFRGLFENCTALKSFYVSAPNAEQCMALMVRVKMEELTPENLYAPKATRFDHFAANSALKRVSFDFSNATILQYAFQNCSNLEEFASDLPKLSDGAIAFDSCKLNKESALRILNSIPTWTRGTHKLTIGIHVDYQNDEEVLAAIALADIAQTPVADGGKGWTLTVQWKGTPTAQPVSTFGLRKPPIYAKLGTAQRPDGTTENFLDWGHYVSNAEENGYQEFSSLAEAYEHFNLEIPTEE